MDVNELGHRDVVSPCFRVGTAEDAEVGFDFLVESLCFSVGLRVVYCGQGDFISEDASKFFCEVRSKLGAAVRDDFVKKSKVSIEFSKNDGGDSISGDCFLRWA